jgi:hypothetical protein
MEDMYVIWRVEDGTFIDGACYDDREVAEEELTANWQPVYPSETLEILHYRKVSDKER